MNIYNNPAMRDPQVQMQMFGLLVASVVALWVVNDARTRGLSGRTAFWWGLGTIMALIIALPLWMFSRPRLRNDARNGSHLDNESNAFPRAPLPNPQDAFAKDATSSTRSKICDRCGKFYRGELEKCPHCETSTSTNQGLN